MSNKYELKNAKEEKGAIQLQFELAEAEPFSKLPKEMSFSLSKKMLSPFMDEPKKATKPAEAPKAKESSKAKDSDKKD